VAEVNIPVLLFNTDEQAGGGGNLIEPARRPLHDSFFERLLGMTLCAAMSGLAKDLHNWVRAAFRAIPVSNDTFVQPIQEYGCVQRDGRRKELQRGGPAVERNVEPERGINDFLRSRKHSGAGRRGD